MRNCTLILVMLFCLVLPGEISAQTYYPLLEDSTTWDTYNHDWSLPACSVTGTDRSFINGDTLINSVLYKKISAYTGVNITPMPCPVWAYDNTLQSEMALMREDTALKKVWRYNESIGQEFLLFDFSLSLGDTFITSFGWDTALSPDTFVVDSTSFLLMLDSSFRKIIYMTFVNFGSVTLHECMIEGIGGSAGFYNPPMNYGIGFASLPGCVIKSGSPLFYGGLYPSWTMINGSCPYLIGQTNRITGNAFVDLNSNNIFDGTDAPLSYKVITETGSGMFDFTDVNGNYEVIVPDSGNFAVEGQLLNNFISVPLMNNVYFPTYLLIDSLNDFAYQPISIFDDLELYFYSSPNRSGMNVTNHLIVKNTGTTILNPVVVFHPDTLLQFVSSTISPFSVSGDSIQWNLPSLAPFQQIFISCTFLVDTGLSIETPIFSFGDVYPLLNDITASNNHISYNGQIVGPFDPNNISVDRDTILTTEFPNPPFLNYFIQFQNVGNDTAFTVMVENPISVYLDISTMEFIGASHSIDIHWNHFLNQLEFTFDNILLPDSNTNEIESHGFIAYRIKPKTNLALNTYILNRASIFFDLNPPVVTNYAQTVVAAPTGIYELPVNVRSVVVYPNPFSEEINLKFSKGVELITVMDLSGRMIIEIPVSKFTDAAILDMSRLSKGVFVIKLTGENFTLVKKVIKL